MFQPVKIAPSILSANFMNFQADIDMIERAGAGYVHYDVIDGHFAPNLTVGTPVLKQLAKHTNLPVDVHLMVTNPFDHIVWASRAGASSITVHAEVLYGEALERAVSAIKEAGCKAAVALKPRTPVAVLKDVIAEVDMVLVMSVEPGFSGQSYIEGSEAKVAEVVDLARAAGASPLVQVDGGIGAKTAPLVSAAGADVLVCGNAVFAAEDPAAAVKSIEDAANEARLAALAACAH